MIIQLPPNVTGPDGLKLRGRWRLQSQDGQRLTYEVSIPSVRPKKRNTQRTGAGADHAALVTIEGGTLEIADDAPPELITALQAAIAGHDAPPDFYAPALTLFALAESAVGVKAEDLTAEQLRALQVLVLWDKRAINYELKVKPLKEWVKFRPVGE